MAILVELLDEFGNLAKGDVHEVMAKLSGAGIFSDTQTQAFSQGISEGYFTLMISSDGTGTMGLKVSADGIDADIVNLESIQYAKVVATIADADTIFVGGKSHAIKLSIVDKA